MGWGSALYWKLRMRKSMRNHMVGGAGWVGYYIAKHPIVFYFIRF
jgi:hypothetical protein